MRKCNQCGFENPDDIHICLRCAASFDRVCASCGSSVPGDNKYCGNCGARMPDLAPELIKKTFGVTATDFKEHILNNMRSRMSHSLSEKISRESQKISGMRREATVLLLDLMNVSTETVDLDREMLFLATDEIMQTLADIVYKYEGTIDKYSSEGMMVLFGVPLNHENDPERAVRAALEMQQIISSRQAQYQQKYPLNLQLCIGINTGSVITGAMNKQNRLEYNVVGNTISLAEQLKNAAAPGQVLVSFVTYQRSNPIFYYKPLTRPDDQDTSETDTEMYELAGLRSNPGRLRGLPGNKYPMIGRSADIKLLKDLFSQTIETKSSQVVLCSGEPGIGKSRLVSDFLEGLDVKKYQYFQGTCAVYMRITPYRVVANLLRSILEVSEMDSDAIQISALQQKISACDLDPGEITAPLLHVLGLPQSDPVMAVRFRFLEPSMLQKESFISIRKFLLAVVQQSPTILVFDDLHWLDKVSAQFLNYFCRSLEHVPVLLLLVGRNFGGSDELDLVRSAAEARDPKPTTIELKPLSKEDTRQLLDEFIPDSSQKSNVLKTVLTEKAGGNPYFAEELVRLLLDNNGLAVDEGGYRILPAAMDMLNQVPGTLQDILQARMDQLSDDLRNLLQKASVLNFQFSAQLLSVPFTENTEVLSVHLDELVAREFLVRTQVGNENSYLFKHPLLQSTVYRTLLRRDLNKYHLAVAVAVESDSIRLTGDRSEILAINFAESSEPERAIPYLIQAAEKAAQNFANHTAEEYFQRALSLMEKYTPADRAKFEIILVNLGRANKFIGNFEKAGSILESVLAPYNERPAAGQVPAYVIEGVIEMADLRIREGNLEQAALLIQKGLDWIGEDGRENMPKLWRRLIERMAWYYFRQGKLEEAHNLADLALFKVTNAEAEDPITYAALYNTLGGIYWNHVRYSEAVESVERSLAIYQNLGYRWGIAAALNNLGVLFFSMNKWPEALERLEKADKIQSDYGFDPERPINLKNIGEVLIAMGDLASARQKFITGLDICQRLNIDLPPVYLQLGLCRLALLENNLDEAEERLALAGRYIETKDEISDRNADFHILQAKILSRKKEHSLALQSAEKANAISEEGEFTDEKIDAMRVLGIVRSAAGAFARAETDFYESIQAAQQSGDRFGEGKGLYEIAIMFLAWSREDPAMQSHYLHQAEHSLDKAIRILEFLGAKRDLQNAQSLRAQLETANLAAESLSTKNRLKGTAALLPTNTNFQAGEWYQAAILYTLLPPSAEDNEELVFETVNSFLPFLTNIAEENNGQVIREQNGFMAIFGAPVAHEDDAERAVETAMQIINLYTEIYHQTELPISIKIGIALGKIIASKPDALKNYAMFTTGEPVDLARLLAEAAGSSRTLVSGPVRNITSYRYEYTAAPSHIYKQYGVENVYQLEGLREQILPVRGLIGMKTPFVGREEEFKSILSLSNRLDQGAGGLVWLEGEAGIGKSRMLHELHTWAAENGKLTWKGECSNRRIDVPFGLFSEMLSRVFDIQQNYTYSQIYNQIDQHLDHWPVELKNTRPYIEFLLGVPPREGGVERLTALEPEQLRRQIFVAMHRIVTRLAEIQPLIVFLDDLQWIDAISADLLLYLTYLIDNHGILFICAHRANEVGAADATLLQVRNMFPASSLYIHLGPLSVETCYTLLDEFLVAAELTDAVKSLIVHQSGGNPYYMEEFVRMLVEQDYLRLVQGRLEVNQVLEISQLNIPNSLETLIRARIDSLPASARQLIQIAAVVGRPFTRDMIKTISERDDINSYLELLHVRGMLKLVPGSMYWQICHPAIETVVYNTVLRAQRKLLHAKIGFTLEKMYAGSENEHADELAYHFSKSDDHARALNYLILAAERAAFRHATEAAITYFTQASDLVNVVPNAGDVVRWRIKMGLGEVTMFAGNYTASVASLQSGLELVNSAELSPSQRAGVYRRLGDILHKLGEHQTAIENLNHALALLGEPDSEDAEEEAARIYARLGWSHFQNGNLEAAKEAILRAVNFGHASNNMGALAIAENYLGGIGLRQGDLAQAMDHTRNAMHYWEEIGYSWGVATTLNNLGILEVTNGNVATALQDFEASLRLRREMGDVEGLAIAYNNLGQMLTDLGDMEQAESHFRNSLLLTRSLRMNFHTATANIGLAHVLIHQGKLDEAAEQLALGKERAKDLTAPDLLTDLHWTEAKLLLLRGKLAEAESTAQQTGELAGSTGNDIMVSAALRIIAECCMQRGDFDSALQDLEKARLSAETGAGNLELGRVNALAMKLHRHMGNPTDADRCYRNAREIFEMVNAKRDLELLDNEPAGDLPVPCM